MKNVPKIKKPLKTRFYKKNNKKRKRDFFTFMRLAQH